MRRALKKMSRTLIQWMDCSVVVVVAVAVVVVDVVGSGA